MIAEFSDSLEYVHFLIVFQLLPDAADGNIKSALTNTIAVNNRNM